MHRRKFLGATATSVGIGIAGCLGDDDDDSPADDTDDSAVGDDDADTDDGTDEIEERHIQVATIFTTEHNQSRYVEAFGDIIEDETDGAITVELLPAVIGGEEDQLEAVASESIQMQGAALTAVAQAYDTGYDFMETPFVVESWDQFNKIAEEFVYEEEHLAGSTIETGNQRPLVHTYRGWRDLVSSYPVHSPEDLGDMRVPQFDTWAGVWGEAGANITPVAWDEIYSAIQTGVADMLEAPVQAFVDADLHELLDYMTATNHLLQTNLWTINEDLWQDLSTTEQEIILDAMESEVEPFRDDWIAETDELIDYLIDEHDLTYIEDIDRSEFENAGQPAIDDFFETRWAVSFEEFQEIA